MSTDHARPGWVLVPLDPTPEAVAAWWRVKNGHHFHDEPAPTDTSDYAAYRALVRVASGACPDCHAPLNEWGLVMCSHRHRQQPSAEIPQ